MASLGSTSNLLTLLAEPSRVRLLALLAERELTVAELTRITELGQSRVSTHLGRLREAGLVRDRRVGGSTFYGLTNGEMPSEARKLWAVVAEELDDAQLETDRARCAAVLRARHGAARWPESVAGEMERHYSPGRTWEALAGGLIGLVVLNFLMTLVGLLACYVGAFFVLPIHFAAVAVAYRQVFPDEYVEPRKPTPEEGASHARALGPHWMLLLRRHGASLAGKSVRECVFRSIYTTRNAELQLRAMAIGALGPLSPGEVAKCGGHNLGSRGVERAWEYWVTRLQKAEAMWAAAGLPRMQGLCEVARPQTAGLPPAKGAARRAGKTKAAATKKKTAAGRRR